MTRHPYSLSRRPRSSVVEDAFLTEERARAYAREFFLKVDISGHRATTIVSGAIDFSARDGNSGCVFYAPNGTRASADYVQNAVNAVKYHESLGRTVRKEVNLAQKVAVVSWKAGKGRTHHG